MIKTILKITGIIIGVSACLLTLVALFLGFGLYSMNTKGAVFAEQAGWKIAGCRAQFDGPEKDLCVGTVQYRQRQEAQRMLDDISDQYLSGPS